MKEKKSKITIVTNGKLNLNEIEKDIKSKYLNSSKGNTISNTCKIEKTNNIFSFELNQKAIDRIKLQGTYPFERTLKTIYPGFYLESFLNYKKSPSDSGYNIYDIEIIYDGNSNNSPTNLYGTSPYKISYELLTHFDNIEKTYDYIKENKLDTISGEYSLNEFGEYLITEAKDVPVTMILNIDNEIDDKEINRNFFNSMNYHSLIKDEYDNLNLNLILKISKLLLDSHSNFISSNKYWMTYRFNTIYHTFAALLDRYKYKNEESNYEIIKEIVSNFTLASAYRLNNSTTRIEKFNFVETNFKTEDFKNLFIKISNTSRIANGYLSKKPTNIGLTSVIDSYYTILTGDKLTKEDKSELFFKYINVIPSFNNGKIIDLIYNYIDAGIITNVNKLAKSKMIKAIGLTEYNKFINNNSESKNIIKYDEYIQKFYDLAESWTSNPASLSSIFLYINSLDENQIKGTESDSLKNLFIKKYFVTNHWYFVSSFDINKLGLKNTDKIDLFLKQVFLYLANGDSRLLKTRLKLMINGIPNYMYSDVGKNKLYYKLSNILDNLINENDKLAKVYLKMKLKER